jgi:excisionase family DNA binding protein
MATQLQRVPPIGDMEPLRNIDELCNWFGISKNTVYKWTSNRHTGLPYYRLGKYLRFRFSEVESWLRKYKASEGAREFGTAK